jgi:DNA-binding transcriptional regulator YiaG
MTPAAFRKLRLAAGLTSQQAAATFLHRSIRTVHAWENGEPIDHLAIDYLRLVVKVAADKP